MNDDRQLTSAQLGALLDVLTHHEAYYEIQALNHSENLRAFGSPLQAAHVIPSSSSPLLRLLLHRFVLPLPGLRDVDSSFWSCSVPDILIALAESHLSESYDKGSVGIRKMLATATSSLIECVSRGILGGYFVGRQPSDRVYDLSSSRDLQAAWDEFLRQAVYHDMVEWLVKKTRETADLSLHSNLVQAAHKYALIMLSSFLHYLLIISPRGQTVLSLLIKVNGLIPYFLLRQTLKIGNVATMLKGMIKIVLTKMSTTTFTSWLGYSAPTDSGLNLLQYIISTVLHWDIEELRKRSIAIERSPNRGMKAHFTAIKAYCLKSPEQQQAIRNKNETNHVTLIQAICADIEVHDLTQEQHSIALEHLAVHLSISDREKLISVLCHHQPDLLTSLVRSLVTAYEPIIRALHEAVDLSSGLSDLQLFLNDLIRLSDTQKKEHTAKPVVKEFYHLLDKHVTSSHSFFHQVFKNSNDLREWYQGYAREALHQYRSKQRQGIEVAAAGDVNKRLQGLFQALPIDEKMILKSELENYAQKMSREALLSFQRFETMNDDLARKDSEDQSGPGIYLAKWQRLMNDTTVTPDYPQNPIRFAEQGTRVDTADSVPQIDASYLLSNEPEKGHTKVAESIIMSKLRTKFRLLLEEAALMTGTGVAREE